MHAPSNWTEVIGGKRYDVDKATLIAGNDYWDGHNWERSGRNTFLYRTEKGNYFTANLTRWEGEKPSLTPVSMSEAIDLWENSLTEHKVEFEKAFPGAKVEDA